MKRPPRIAAVLRILGCSHDSILATPSDISVFFLHVTHTFLALIKDYKIFLVAEKTSAILRRSPLYYNQFYPWCKR